MKKIAFVAVVLGALLFATAHVWAASPVGKWKTIDDETGKAKSIIEIYEQNGKIYGKILESLKPGGAKGEVCDKCEGADKGKPIIGLVIVKGLAVDGDQYAGGTITDPNKGKTYKCKMKVIEGGKKLQVSGCISVLCRKQIWLKAD